MDGWLGHERSAFVRRHAADGRRATWVVGHTAAGSCRATNAIYYGALRVFGIQIWPASD